MLQRPNLFTGAYPICKKKKKWWGPRGEVRRVMLYSLWMDLKQSESITEKIYICANPPENVQERDTSKKKKKTLQEQDQSGKVVYTLQTNNKISLR